VIINPYRFAAAGDPVSSPLHYWDLTDLSATTGGGIYDQGSGNWGGLTSADFPLVSSGGAPDGVADCLDFVPLPINSDHLTMSTPKAWDGGTNDMSISLWVYHDTFAAADYESLLAWLDGPGAGNRLTWMRVQTDTTYDHLEYRIYDENDVNDVAEDDSATGDLTAGQWYHYVGIWNGTTGVLDLYVDNALYATTTNGSIGDLDTTAHEFVIGSAFGGSLGLDDSSLDGRMFAVGIYNYPLTADDRTHLFNSGNGRTFSQL